MGWGALLVGVGVLCSGALWAASADPTVVPVQVHATIGHGGIVTDATRATADRYAGEFVASVETNTANRDAAIEDLVAELNVLIRPIARQKLRDGNPIATSLAIGIEGDSIAVAFDGKRDVAALDGTTTEVVGIQGDSLDYSVHVDDARLRQQYTGERGGRSNEIVVAPDRAVSIAVEMTSPRLPKPLRYQLSYRSR